MFLNNNGGNLLHISSIQGIGAPKFDHYKKTDMTSPIEYSAIKAGIIAITKYLAHFYKNKNIRVNYGYEELYDNNFTLSFNYERLQHLDTEKFSHSDSFFLKLGRIKEEDYEFTFSLDALQDYKLSSHYSTQLNEFDLKIESNYNFMSENPEYGAMLQISNNF